MAPISPAFKDRIIAVHGQKGQKWLSALPALQENLSRRWSLSDIQPVHDLTYNYLVYATALENKPVVLKLGVPHKELNTEIKALRIFNGDGTVRLLEDDPTLGAILLERIQPGENLLSIQDDQETTRIAAAVMKRIWKQPPSDSSFPTAGDWCKGFDRYLDLYPGAGPLPGDLVRSAADLSVDLLSSSPPSLLLHGDLHHTNILLDENRGWIAIDPKGVIGEPAFEIGSLMLNPVPDLIHWPDLKQVLQRRLIILDECLDLDRERLASWSFVRGVLSAIWSVEDNEYWNNGIKVAAILRELV